MLVILTVLYNIGKIVVDISVYFKESILRISDRFQHPDIGRACFSYLVDRFFSEGEI